MLLKLYKLVLEKPGSVEEIVRFAADIKNRESARILSWLLLRASSAITSLFSSPHPPSSDAVATLETLLADIGVEAMLYAKRGILGEREAREFARVLFSDEIMTALGECKRGSCKPRRLYELGLALRVLGVALQIAAGEPLRACVSG